MTKKYKGFKRKKALANPYTLMLLALILIMVFVVQKYMPGAFAPDSVYLTKWNGFDIKCKPSSTTPGWTDADFTDGTVSGVNPGYEYSKKSIFSGTVTSLGTLDFQTNVNQGGQKGEIILECSVLNLDLNGYEKVRIVGSGKVQMNGMFEQSGGGGSRICVNKVCSIVGGQSQGSPISQSQAYNIVTFEKIDNNQFTVYNLLDSKQYNGNMITFYIKSIAHGDSRPGTTSAELSINEIELTGGKAIDDSVVDPDDPVPAPVGQKIKEKNFFDILLEAFYSFINGIVDIVGGLFK